MLHQGGHDWTRRHPFLSISMVVLVVVEEAEGSPSPGRVPDTDRYFPRSDSTRWQHSSSKPYPHFAGEMTSTVDVTSVAQAIENVGCQYSTILNCPRVFPRLLLVQRTPPARRSTSQPLSCSCRQPYFHVKVTASLNVRSWTFNVLHSCSKIAPRHNDIATFPRRRPSTQLASIYFVQIYDHPSPKSHHFSSRLNSIPIRFQWQTQGRRRMKDPPNALLLLWDLFPACRAPSPVSSDIAPRSLDNYRGTPIYCGHSSGRCVLSPSYKPFSQTQSSSLCVTCPL